MLRVAAANINTFDKLFDVCLCVVLFFQTPASFRYKSLSWNKLCVEDHSGVAQRNPLNRTGETLINLINKTKLDSIRKKIEAELIYCSNEIISIWLVESDLNIEIWNKENVGNLNREK